MHYESLSAFWRSSASFASISSECRFLGNVRPSPFLSGEPGSVKITLKQDWKRGDAPSASQQKPVQPTAPLFPPENLTPILLPPHIIQLDLSVRALYHPPLIEAQPVLRGGERIMWVCQIRNQTQKQKRGQVLQRRSVNPLRRVNLLMEIKRGKVFVRDEIKVVPEERADDGRDD